MSRYTAVEEEYFSRQDRRDKQARLQAKAVAGSMTDEELDWSMAYDDAIRMNWSYDWQARCHAELVREMNEPNAFERLMERIFGR